MRTFKVDLSERLKSAAKAKEAALEKFAERKPDDDPEVLARRAARLETAKAREARVAEREAKKVEEKARKKAEAELEAAKKAERELTLAAEQKAARDARYAARKAKK